MKITLDNNYFATTSQTLLGYMGEICGVKITLENFRLEGADLYKLQFEYSDGISYQVDVTNGEYTVEGSVLRAAGKVKCQLIAVKMSGENYSYVKKSNIFNLIVKASLSDEPAPVPTYEKSVEVLDKVLGVETTCKNSAASAAVSAQSAEQSKTSADESAALATNAQQSAANSAAQAEQSANDLTYSSELIRNIMLMPDTKFLLFKSKAGQFDMSVTGFTNPVWTYNGVTITGSNAQFTILNDNDVVKLSWSSAGSTMITVNQSGRAQAVFCVKDLFDKCTLSIVVDGSAVTGDLKDFDNVITTSYYVQNTAITGDLACLDGKLTGTIHIAYTNIHGIYTPTTASLTRFYCSYSKMTITDVDTTLNNIATKAQEYNKSSGTIEGNGMKRTAASDTAITTLVGLGWTISGFAKVVS